jgi:hypothetical protein
VALEQIILFLEMLKKKISQRKNIFVKKNEDYLKKFHNSLLSKWSAR